MIVLGLDTATSSTAVALRSCDGSVSERRDDPPPGEHPGHATRLLVMADELMRASARSWGALERVAVGLGPGSFTGLRVGVATAHGLALSRSLELVGVSSLRALALAALAPSAPPRASGERPDRVVAVIDARRGEVFSAVYERGEDGLPRPLGAPSAVAPERLAELLAAGRREEHLADGGVRVVGDGAVRYAALLAARGIAIEPAGSIIHRVQAAAICELGATSADPLPPTGQVLPDYLRRPDAELALEGATGA